MTKQAKKHFQFSHQVSTPGDFILERLFGILPGFISWSILISAVALSFFKPLYAAILIIAVDIYWLLRILYMTIFLVLAYLVLDVEKNINWIERCHALERGEEVLRAIRRRRGQALRYGKLKYFINLNNQIRELKRVITDRVSIPAFDSIYHVVIVAAAKEGRAVVEPGIAAMVKGEFPSGRILPVIAVEARTGLHQQEMAEKLREQYKDHFFDFLVTVHPDGIPGETKVKGANVTYAAQQAAQFLSKKKIDFANVVVSCFDADTVPGPNYFSALTYHFMRHPKRTRASFQPIPVYHNNILDAPGFVRILETGSSFFQLIEATNPEKLVTFSSHSMSFKALVEIDYWPVDMISDDSAIFWKALIYYGGDYRVVPMYVTLSMDVIMTDNFWKTLISVYLQKRRWAWGVENFPIVMRAFVKEKGISLWNKLRYTVKLLEMHISWASLGFLVTLIGWLPAIFAGREFSNSVAYYNASRVTSLIFNLASTTLIVTIILALLLLPKQKARLPLHKRVLFALEWLLIPLVFTFLSSMPAMDAQTRLMRGLNMEFRVSEKKRKA